MKKYWWMLWVCVVFPSGICFNAVAELPFQHRIISNLTFQNESQIEWAFNTLATLGSVQVKAGITVGFEAGDSIHINSGFSVQPGAIFYARTDTSARGSSSAIIANPYPHYDYQPTAMFDEGKYKIWWCGSPSDVIRYAEADSPAGPWIPSGGEIVFSATGNSNNFDGYLTCAPSVIKVGGIYYLYYEGYPYADQGFPNPLGNENYNSIGVAWSNDGRSFNDPTGINGGRMNGGNPIVKPRSLDIARAHCSNLLGNGGGGYGYGTGYPSVSYVDGKFYLIRHDSSGVLEGGDALLGHLCDNPILRPVQVYALRASNPTFTQDLEELRPTGWEPIISALEPFSDHGVTPAIINAELVYDPLSQLFLMATGGKPSYTSLRFFPGNSGNNYENALYGGQVSTQLNLYGDGFQGPALFRRPNGQSIYTTQCKSYSWDFVIGVLPPGSSDPYASDLSWIGYDYPIGWNTCNTLPFDYDGDRKADYTVYRPYDSIYLDSRFYKHGSSSGIEMKSIGNSRSSPISGDFDADGLLDYAVVTPNSSGLYNWEMILSGSGYNVRPSWGEARYNDIPFVGDFDGDGKDGIAVYRPGNSHWYLHKDLNNINDVEEVTDFAWVNQIPAVGDFDGDQIDDLAILKNGNFQIKYGNGSFGTIGGFASSTMTTPVPLVGDYDNDGIDDCAYWDRNSTNQRFYIRYSSTKTYFSLPLTGQATDILTSGDWNKDNWLDLAVVRLSTMTWYRVNLGFNTYTNGYGYQWGLAGDKVPQNPILKW